VDWIKHFVNFKHKRHQSNIGGRRSDGLPDLSGRGTAGRFVNAGQGQVGDPLSIPGEIKLGLHIFQRSCCDAGLDSRIVDAGEGLVMAGSVSTKSGQ